MKILGALWELPAKQHCQSSPFWPNWPNQQCCLAGSSQRAPRILIFSIAMGADYSFYVKIIETHARAFLPLNISAIGTVPCMPLWTGLVILIWKLFSMSGYRKYINGIWFWHRNPNFGLKKSWKAKKGHKGQWRPAKAKKVQNSKNL